MGRNKFKYNKNTDTYEYAYSLPTLNVDMSKHLNLGSAIRNGTSKIAKPIGETFVEVAALHPILGIAKAGVDAKLAKTMTDKYLSAFSAYPIPILNNLFKVRKVLKPISKTVDKLENGITRISYKTPSKELGHIDLANSMNKTNGLDTVYPDYIKVNEQGKGLSHALYAAGIKETKKPIISGEVLLQPEKTTKSYKYFEGPELPPLINEPGYDYNRKLMLRPKNKNLDKDIINNYQENNPERWTTNANELYNIFKNLWK